MKSKYDKKIVNSSKSSDKLRLKKLRRIVLLAWLLVAITVGIVVYKVYAEKKLSDTPIVAMERDKGVSTGTDLDEEKDFGPWE